MEVGGRIAYVAQQAWIVNDTVKENILFGRPLIEDYWRKTLQACSLESDLEVCYSLFAPPEWLGIL